MSNSSADISTSAAAPPSLPLHVQLIQMMNGVIIAHVLHSLAELGIADLLKAGPQSAEELARHAGAHAPSLYRVLRSAAGLGLLVEDANRRFVSTSLGATLQSDAPGYARSSVRILGGPFFLGMLGETLHAVKTGEPAILKAHGQSAFEFLKTNPSVASLFNDMMIGFHGAEPPAVAAAYDFSAIDTLIDVGGGTGNLLTTILTHNTKLKGVLYDLPQVVVEGRRLIETRQLSHRCEMVEGSFFEAVPSGGDAYLLSHIIHDWDEASCLKILGNVRRALPAAGRLLLVEMVIPDGNDFHLGKLTDVIMLAIGGRERTATEYAQLLTKAGFKLTRIIPTQSPVSVIEATPA